MRIQKLIDLNNNYTFEQCSLCGSSDLYKVGEISYQYPVLFSSNKISILNQPELWRCSNCKSALVKNAINEFDAISLYSKGNSSERWRCNSSFEDDKTQNVINILENLFKGETKKILDIGCNMGDLLDFAQRCGCKTFGLEYSSSSLEIIKAKGHIPFSSMDEIKESFSLIVAFDLIEHLYNVPDFLSKCYDFLEPGGMLILLTGNINSLSARVLGANWWYVKYPEHIVFPSKKYFENQTKLKLTNYVKVFHSKFSQTSIRSVIRFLVSNLLRRRKINCSYIPILEPDHIIVTLTKLKK